MKITRETFMACQQVLNEVKRKMDQVKELEEELAAYLMVADNGSGYYGHVSDAIYGEGNYEIKPLLSKLKYSYDSNPKSKKKEK